MRAIVLLLLGFSLVAQSKDVVVASKKFTENVILGEMVSLLLEHHKIPAFHQSELGGTQVLWKGLGRGDIDIYAEYTGTLRKEMFRDEDVNSFSALRAVLKKHGILTTKPLGFNNTYAISMRRKKATELGLTKLSQLKNFPELRLGFTEEFIRRSDGWPSLKQVYELPHTAQSLDHDLAYRGLEAGSLDVLDAYSTDAEIAYYDLVTLEDDKQLFPEYQAVILYRADLVERIPDLAKKLAVLENSLTGQNMSELNSKVKIQGKSERNVAAGFLSLILNTKFKVVANSFWNRMAQYTIGHLKLVSISMLLAILVSLPLGILAARMPRTGHLILGVTGILQTIPSLALLVFMIPWFGIGTTPAIAALFFYSLLPIVRNTYTGLKDIPYPLIESADALGLPSKFRLLKIELPLASRSILAGIKTSTVINIGTATLGALVGAGGFGQPILTGIRLDDIATILEGAIPAALLAIVAQVLFEWSERWLVPKGLRLVR